MKWISGSSLHWRGAIGASLTRISFKLWRTADGSKCLEAQMKNISTVG